MNRFKVLLNSYLGLILVLLDSDMSKILITGNFLGQQTNKKREYSPRTNREAVLLLYYKIFRKMS